MGSRVGNAWRYYNLWALGRSTEVSLILSILTLLIKYRALLQKVLAPPSFFEHPPTQQLVAGDTRLCTEFRLFVEFPEEIDLRIPCREASKVCFVQHYITILNPLQKDWQFDKLPDLGQSRRQAAQLSCKISKNSSVNYIMPMVASKDGYETSLDVQLYRISVESSLNNKVFLEAEECRVSYSCFIVYVY